MATATTPAWSDTEFPSMGSTARLLILGGPADLPDLARTRLRAAGGPMVPVRRRRASCPGSTRLAARSVVSPTRRSTSSRWPWVPGARRTAGSTRPCSTRVEQAGYDRDFAAIESGRRPGTPIDPEPASAPGCAGHRAAPLVPAVRLPLGVRIDLGGIGKGRAADLLAERADRRRRRGGLREPRRRRPGHRDRHRARRTGRSTSTRRLAAGRSFRLADGGGGDEHAAAPGLDRGRIPAAPPARPRSGRPAWTGLASVTVLAAQHRDGRGAGEGRVRGRPRRRGRAAPEGTASPGCSCTTTARVESCPASSPSCRERSSSGGTRPAPAGWSRGSSVTAP